MASRPKAGTFAGTGEGMALSDVVIRNAKGRAKRYRLSDSHGLSIEISPSNTPSEPKKYWRYRYRIGGKENLFAAGKWWQAPIGETPEQAADRQQGGRAARGFPETRHNASVCITPESHLGNVG
jgi:Arm DNA-binding domain